MAIPQRMGSTRPAPAQVSPYLRYAVAGVGALAVLLGVIAVFTTLNGVGALALLVGGVALIVAGLFARVPTLMSTRRQDTDILLDLLRSADPGVRMAAAEAVLDTNPRPAITAGDARGAALEALIERDLVRRLADLLRRAGHVVESDTLASGSGNATADVVVRVTGSQGLRPVPITVKTVAGGDGTASVQQMAAVVSRFGAKAGLLLYTGAQVGDVPLGSVTPFGEAVVFSVYSPRLTDEQTILSAVSRAADVGPAAVEAPTSQDSPQPGTSG